LRVSLEVVSEKRLEEPMPDTSKNDDEIKFNETLKRMLTSPPKPHVPPKPDGKKKEKPAK